MNWYKKDVRPHLILAYGQENGICFAQLLKNSLPCDSHVISFISTVDENLLHDANQKIVCTDMQSAIKFSHIKDNVHVFAQSPYASVKSSGRRYEEQMEVYLELHNSLSKAARIITLTESSRSSIQRHHAKHIYLTQLPSTFSESVCSLYANGIAVIANDSELDLYKNVLDNFRDLNPTLYISSRYGQYETNAIGLRLPEINPVSIQPKIQIYLGSDQSDCTPLRLIDASAAGSVVVQISYGGGERSEGRYMPTDCIGYFRLDKGNSDIAEINTFILHLISNQMFFDSVLSAQRRYLPNFQSNSVAFFELLTK